MKLIYLFQTLILSLILISCSSDDSDIEPAPTAPNVINSIEISKKFAFIEETVTINIDATNFSEIEILSNDNSITTTKINDFTYAVNASKATVTNITVSVSGEAAETIDLSFYEHGVSDFKVVEGLTLDLDTPEKVRILHGEPNYISPQDDNEEVWYYFEKGFWILMDNNVNQAHYMRLYGIDWSRNFENIDYIGKQYPYEISEGLKIENLQLSMTTVVDMFGTPTEKFDNPSGNGIHSYDYEDLEVLFYFQSDDVDDFEGKSVGYINVY